MFEMYNSSQPSYKSINNVTIDLDKNKLAYKKSWSCTSSRLFAVMVIVIGICLLIYEYGFNGGKSFGLNTLIMKHLNVNDDDINDGINVNADSVDYSWNIIGVSDMDMLSHGDIITIRGLYSGLLENPSGTDRMRSVKVYKSNRILWQVGESYHNGYKTYYFKNLERNCYLTETGDLKSKLKCLSLNVNSYWIAHGDSPYYHADHSNRKRYYSRLANDVTGNCLNIERTATDPIFIDEIYCNYVGSMVLFEIVKSATTADTSSLGTELIDSSLRIKEDSNSVTLTDEKFLGIGNINGLNNGNIVTIRGFNSGLLKAPNENGKITSLNVYADSTILWIVGYDSGRKAYYFQNYGNSNCYMATSSDNVLTCSSNLSDVSYWVNGGNHYYSGDSSDHPRVYTSIKNYDSNKCLRIEGTTDTKIDLRGNDCGGASASSWVRFEIVSYQ